MGVELQGQVVDFVMKDSTVNRRILPGAELPYGMTGAIPKVVTMLRSLFLVCGPDKRLIRYACACMRSCTTDNGTDINLVRTRDLSHALIQWMNDVPFATLRPLVEQSKRLWPNAIRIIGMGHTCGGIMFGV